MFKQCPNPQQQYALQHLRIVPPASLGATDAEGDRAAGQKTADHVLVGADFTESS